MPARGCAISWQAGATRATGDLILATDWNAYLGAGGSLDFASTHTHTGAAGDGSTSLGPLVKADFTTAAAPAAPGAGKGRFYVVTGDRPGFRSGAAGAAEVLVTRDEPETLAAKTLTTPTVDDLTNMQHDHADAAGGGAASMLGHKRAYKAATETVNNSVTLQNDDDFLFAIGASEVWDVLIYCPVSWPNAADFKFTFAGPTGMTFSAQLTAWAATTPMFVNADAGQAQGTAISLVTGNDGDYMILHALIINSTNAGTVNFKWAQATAVATNTNLEAGGTMIAHLVSP